jgi:hypothetical protein
MLFNQVTPHVKKYSITNHQLPDPGAKKNQEINIHHEVLPSQNIPIFVL